MVVHSVGHSITYTIENLQAKYIYIFYYKAKYVKPKRCASEVYHLPDSSVISCNRMQQIHFHRENRLNIGIYLLKHNYITLEQGVKNVQS